MEPTIRKIKAACPTNSAGGRPLGVGGIAAEIERYAVQKDKTIMNGKPEEKRISVPEIDSALVSMFSLPTVSGTLIELS
jgi:hypothetical protein